MAKDPKRRYQRGSDFAEAVAELHARLVPPSNPTRTGTRTGTVARPRALSRNACRRGLPTATKLVRSAILKAPVRDLVLGVATIIMLFVVGVQTKLLVFSQKEAIGTATAIPTRVPPVPVATKLDMSETALSRQEPLPASPPAAIKPAVVTALAKPPSKKSRTPISPPKEVVVPLSTVELTVRQRQFKDATLSIWAGDSKRGFDPRTLPRWRSRSGWSSSAGSGAANPKPCKFRRASTSSASARRPPIRRSISRRRFRRTSSAAATKRWPSPSTSTTRPCCSTGSRPIEISTSGTRDQDRPADLLPQSHPVF